MGENGIWQSLKIFTEIAKQSATTHIYITTRIYYYTYILLHIYIIHQWNYFNSIRPSGSIPEDTSMNSFTDGLKQT